MWGNEEVNKITVNKNNKKRCTIGQVMRIIRDYENNMNVFVWLCWMLVLAVFCNSFTYFIPFVNFTLLKFLLV